MTNLKTALLFFSFRPLAEIRRKRWTDSNLRTNLGIAQKLYASSLDCLGSAGLPLFLFDERNQRGDTFGQRLANAFEDVYAEGYDNVICVGNDSPDLNALNFGDLSSQIGPNQAVLGPNLRNGLFLIGLHSSAFDKSTFASLAWKQEALLDQFLEYLASRSLKAVCLCAQQDLNTTIDICRAALQENSSALVMVLYAMICCEPSSLDSSCSRVLAQPSTIHCFGMRAPPAVLAFSC